MKKLLTILLFSLLVVPIMAENKPSPDEIITYKQTQTRPLSLHAFYPDGHSSYDSRAAVICFFGGGWSSGSPEQFYNPCEYFNSLGLVAFSADYRIAKKDNTTPFEAVSDAKSAVRWVREHSEELGVDPNKIVVAGGSAGGHLAACTATIEGYEDYSHLFNVYSEEELAERCEDYVSISASSVPNAMILFNPVVDTTSEGYGAKKLVGHETELSPTHHVKEGLPPTLIMHGTQDKTVPYQNAVDFSQKMISAGNQCILVPAFGENHGFFNGSFRPASGLRNYERCMAYSANFLFDLGFTSERIEVSFAPIRVACVGNSITYGSRVENRKENCYPSQLQLLLGDDYLVGNFGKSGSTLLEHGDRPYTQTDEYKKLLEFAPDVVIIKLGTNDSKAINWQYGERFEEDYNALIKTFKETNERTPQVFVCSPVPAFIADTTYINNTIIRGEIYPIAKHVAEQNKLTFIELYQPFEDKEELFPDKVHPSVEGAKLLARFIYEAIAQQ